MALTREETIAAAKQALVYPPGFGTEWCWAAPEVLKVYPHAPAFLPDDDWLLAEGADLGRKYG